MAPDDVITSFVAHLNDSKNQNLIVDKWPDKKNRSSEDIDAIAGNLAIEHTSIDVVNDMRQRNDWFMKAVGGLEAELSPGMQFRLRINIDYESIDKGQKWNEIRNTIRNWIIGDSKSLPEGFQIIQIPGVPFDMRVEKVTDEPPALILSRSFKKEQETLESSVGPLIERKARKLKAYTKSGMLGILLVQSEDIAFMSRNRLAKAILDAFPDGLPEGVNEVWYADVTIAPTVSFHNLTALAKLIKEQTS